MSAKSILKFFFCGFLSFGLLFTAWGVNAATPDCPECPADKDGSIFPGGSCKNCGDPEDKDGSIFPGGSCERCSAQKKSDKVVRIVDAPKKRACRDAVAQGCPIYKNSNYTFAKPRYKSTLDRNCCDMASFALEHVDFKLNGKESYTPYSGHVGNYRFRIFGCRRATKKAMLNHGRVIQKNMAFQDVFRKAADKCYKVMEIPGDVCFSDPSVKLPEYVLTAEITNFFMNICDEYDWDKARKTNKRGGSAEMTVTWRLLNLSQTKVLWKGVTTGYAEVEDGVYEGEVKLAEESFADAASMLRTLPGFEAQLMVRPTAREMAAERASLVAFDEKFNPGKCGFAEEIAYTKSCAYAPQPQCPAPMPTPIPAPMPCPCAVQQPCVCTQPVCSCPQVSCPCATPAKPEVKEFVDVKTEKKIIEKKIITTTRVETPAPVCRPVCQPVCQQPQINCQLKCTQECEKPKCRTICTRTCEEGKEDQCTEKCVEDCGDKPVVPSKKEEIVYEPVIEEKSEIKVSNQESTSQIEEDGGVEVSNQETKPQIEEDGGVTDTHRVYENCIDENGNVIADGSCTVIDDNWVDLEGYSVDAKLCVADRPPYKELSPENMLTIRNSVVDITNANGKNGIGLIISDSFVLTSASLVNKLKNTYDVKTLNGDVLKAKAVRYNPSKNIALLALEKPTTYTPLSLNLELPAIDQEGFISLGALGNGETAQNYMDDNGKIHGYRYSDTLGTEIIVDTLVQKVTVGSVLIDRLGTISGISNSAKQTKEGMDLFIPTETALRSVGLSVCEKLYDKKSPWEKTVYKPVSEKIKQETKTPEMMKAGSRK